MSLVRRMRDMTVASFNDWLEQTEDPVRMIDQALQELHLKIKETQTLVQRCKFQTRSAKSEYLAAAEMRDKREQQALTAMKAGEEGLARIAMTEKMTCEEQAEAYKDLYEQNSDSLVEMERELQKMQNEFQELHGKRSYYVTRLESLRLQRSFQTRMCERTGVASRLRQLEDRVRDLESETRTYWDLRKEINDGGQRVGEELDRRLQALKQKLEKEGWNRS